MSLVNNSANNFKDFLDAIKPYLNYQFYDLSGQGVEANNFSTDEKVIGTWIDGKPLYQKTINGLSITTIWNGTMFAYANVSPLVNDIDNVIDACGLGIEPTSNKKAYISSIDIQVKNDEWQLQIVNNYVINTITLKYTKTTDTAVASGEKIVGQWIDGKPVFEKNLTYTINSNTSQSIQHNISNLDRAWISEGIIKNSNSETYSLLLDNHFIDFVFNSTTLTFRKTSEYAYSDREMILKIRYTKTS